MEEYLRNRLRIQKVRDMKNPTILMNKKESKTDGYAAVGISNSLDLDFNFEQEITTKIVNELSEKKQQAFLDKLKILGIEIDLEIEQKRRFKRFFSVFKDNEETIYFNDDSLDGLRIITYVTKQTPFDFKDRCVSVGYDISYY
jgi:hypothetical protein